MLGGEEMKWVHSFLRLIHGTDDYQSTEEMITDAKMVTRLNIGLTSINIAMFVGYMCLWQK